MDKIQIQCLAAIAGIWVLLVIGEKPGLQSAFSVEMGNWSCSEWRAMPSCKMLESKRKTPYVLFYGHYDKRHWHSGAPVTG